MKKIIAFIFVLVLIVGNAGAAFAAESVFSDVPANHWAYDAAAKLVKAGVIEGYNDASFRGDRLITRYEMAVIVAKALQNTDKADAESKAILDKLSIEFSKELTNMGVRLSAVESKLAQNAQKHLINWSGSNFRIRYDHKTKDGVTVSTSDDFNYTMELVGSSDIGDGWTAELRLEGSRAINNANHSVDNKSGAFDLESYVASGPVGAGTLRVGRMENILINGLVLDQFMTGLSYQYGSKMKVLVTEGKLDYYTALPNTSTVVSDLSPTYGATLASINFQYPVSNRTTLDGGYYRTYSPNKLYKKGIIKEFAVTQKVGDDWKLIADYAESNRSDNAKATLAGIGYKAAVPSTPKSYGWNLDYVKNDAKATIVSAYDIADYGYTQSTKVTSMSKTNGQEGYQLTYRYVPVKNVLFTGRYLEAKPVNGTSYSKEKWYRAQLEFFF
ncbi:MAG: S-layer protein [Firmicutes bacterium]|nr:S-layer protein [Bacillota bacterium]